MILVTGANGFLGRSLNLSLQTRRLEARGAVRQGALDGQINVGNIDAHTDWHAALAGIETVIHTAARAHVMRDSAEDPLDLYRIVNVAGSLNLARQAVEAKVKRFIFISSVKVNGELTLPGKPFTTQDQPNPGDPYGISKWEAEQGLRQLSQQTGLEVVIIRPPLVYGPGVKANFERMLRWVKRGLPLPLGSIDNKRSLVAIDNLVDLIVTCSDHPAAANQTFFASDGQDVSTPDLLRALGRALHSPARLLPCPVSLLLLAAALLGKRAEVQRLTGNLQVDISKTGSLLAWQPVVTLEQGLGKTAEGLCQ